VSIIHSSMLIIAIALLGGPLSAQPTAVLLSAKQPVAFQPVSDFVRPTSDAAYKAAGVDHTILLSAAGDIDLYLPGFGAPALRIAMLGGKPNPAIAPEELLAGTAFEYIGNDRSKWRAMIPLYARLRYRDVYPGIDLVYHGNQGQYEFDFFVKPGSDPGNIRMALRGAAGVQKTAAGDLVLSSATTSISMTRPMAYQAVAGQRRNVNATYEVLSTSLGPQSTTVVSIELGNYDPTAPLIIDPVLVWTIYPCSGSA
jgi:hypothetical protein